MHQSYKRHLNFAGNRYPNCVILSLHHIDKQWKSLRVQMDEFVLRRKEELGADALNEGKQRKDLFSRLVGALDEEAKVGLSMGEVVSTFHSVPCPGARVLTCGIDWQYFHFYVRRPW